MLALFETHDLEKQKIEVHEVWVPCSLQFMQEPKYTCDNTHFYRHKWKKKMQIAGRDMGVGPVCIFHKILHGPFHRIYNKYPEPFVSSNLYDKKVGVYRSTTTFKCTSQYSSQVSKKYIKVYMITKSRKKIARRHNAYIPYVKYFTSNFEPQLEKQKNKYKLIYKHYQFEIWIQQYSQ